MLGSTLVKLLSLAFSNHEWRRTFLWVPGLREEVQQPLATVPSRHWRPPSPLLPLLHLSWRSRFCAPEAHWATTPHCPTPREGQESQAVLKWGNSATSHTSCPWATSIGCLPYPWGVPTLHRRWHCSWILWVCSNTYFPMPVLCNNGKVCWTSTFHFFIRGDERIFHCTWPLSLKAEKTASTSSYDPKSDLDYEFGSGTEYELLEESVEANSSSVSEHSTGTQEKDTRRVISMDEYRSRKVDDKRIEEMQEAVASLVATAGYQSLLEDV